MRRYIPALLLALTAFALPLAGCDLIAKMKGGADAGADATVEAVVDAAPAPTAEAVADAAPTTLPVVPTAAKAVVHAADASADAAHAVDASITPADAGGLVIPNPKIPLPVFQLDGGLRSLLNPDAGLIRRPH
jgi:hypothetical protein